MKKHNRQIFLALSGITQLGLSVAISFLLWIFIASWVKRVFHLGNFVMLAGIFLGLGSAILSFKKFCKFTSSEARDDEE